MLEQELDTAIHLSKKAGERIRALYALEIIAESKFGVDNFAEPVTDADREASQIIVSGLSQTFPNDAVLSEEEADTADTRLTSERVWIIDPIDGTSGFIKKDGDFAVQIGFVDNGLPIVGVIYLPAHDRLYYASKNSGAFVVNGNGRPQRLTVSENTDFRLMDLAVSRNHRSPKISKIVEELGFRKEVQRGSVGVKIGLIAERVCDVYIHLSPRTKFWDTCGPQVIIKEAGGRLTDIFGDPLKYDLRDVQNHNGIMASNGVCHDEAVKRLQPLLTEWGRVKIKTASTS